MTSKPVTIRVKEEVLRVAEEMVELGLASSRNQALNMILEAGLLRAIELISRRRKVLELLGMFEKEGLPYENLPTARDVEEGRE